MTLSPAFFCPIMHYDNENAFGIRRRRPAMTLLAVAGIFVAACDQQQNATAESATASATAASSASPAASATVASTGASMTASQAMIRQEPGKKTITWDTGTGAVGEVYVYDGSVEKLFARGPKGSSEATWMAPGMEFRLYEGTDHKTVLARVTATK